MADEIVIRPRPPLGPIYFKSYQGILKQTEIVLSVIAIALAVSASRPTYFYEFLVAAGGTVASSAFVILLYFTKAIKKSWKLWIKIELNFAFVWSIFLFFCSFMAYKTDDKIYSSAGIIGFGCCLCFFADGFHKFELDGKI